jgi:lipoyl(octanoyl) transferase
MQQVHYIDLGIKDYKETWDFQLAMQEALIRGKMDKGTSSPVHKLIFVEHPHVYTLGKSGKENNLLIRDDLLKSIKASFYKIDRGGDITYHGPGQLVGYPIFDLDAFHMGVKEYIHKLEQSIIATLEELGLKSSRMEGATGVWLDAQNPRLARKICAIGVKVSRSVTLHGFALNVNTDLNYFRYINPCGFIDKGVTSLEKEMDKVQSMDSIKERLRNHMQVVFDFQLKGKWHKNK